MDVSKHSRHTHFQNWESSNFPEEICNENFAYLVDEKDIYRHYIVKNGQEDAVATSFMKIGFSKVELINGEMEITLYIESFEPNNFTVAIEDNFIILKGKHDSIIDYKNSDHIISREIVRKYLLPRNCKRDEIRAEIDHGKLMVTVPYLTQSYNRIIEIKEYLEENLEPNQYNYQTFFTGNGKSNLASLWVNEDAAKSEQATVGINESASKSEQLTIEGNEGETKSVQATIGVNESASKSEQLTIEGNEGATKSVQATIGVNEIASKSEQVTIEGNEGATKSEQATTGENEGVARPERVTIGVNDNSNYEPFLIGENELHFLIGENERVQTWKDIVAEKNVMNEAITFKMAILKELCADRDKDNERLRIDTNEGNVISEDNDEDSSLESLL